MATNVLKVLEALSSEKEAIRRREEKLLSGLREVLGRFGYRLEPLAANERTNGSGRRGSSMPTRRRASSGSKPLTCTACGRTFALPLHLGRHMSTMHKGEPAASAKPSPPTTENRSTNGALATKTPRRRRMSAAARRAAARRMKAYWRKRKATATKRPPRPRKAAA